MTRLAFVVAMVSLAAASPAVADSTTLTGPSLHQAVAGKTVSISSPVGSIPVRYRMNGTMSASSTALAAVTGSARDSGRWWVSGDKLCQRWSAWLEAKTHCVTLRRSGATLHWAASDGRTGVASVSR
jgi:hypothetical protein